MTKDLWKRWLITLLAGIVGSIIASFCLENINYFQRNLEYFLIAEGIIGGFCFSIPMYLQLRKTRIDTDVWFFISPTLFTIILLIVSVYGLSGHAPWGLLLSFSIIAYSIFATVIFSIYEYMSSESK
jgi:uncharacterized membrane protein YeaQ/YmgE (transglycosylase-associated protein family)